MILNLSSDAGETLQEQIVRQIRSRILSGDLAPGSELPSIRSLAREHRVSVLTVQRSYELLERAGLVHAQRSVGFFVARLDESARTALARTRFDEQLRPLVEQALREGLSAEQITQIVGNLVGELVGR